MAKACAICGALATHGTRCNAHPLQTRGRPHRRASASTLLYATVCWICNKPGTQDDPLTRDHVHALALGGHNTATNYRAAHRSCNSRGGANITNAA